MKIKKGDNVKIISGKDKGKIGKVTKSFPVKNKIIVEGANLRKKHMRPTKQGQKGQMVQIAMPMDVSNAIIMCGSCNKPTRVGMRMSGEKKSRVCKKCGADL